ncbi:hypothetical protein SVAN01_08570 [Stagonosporopsis vannaccii]|nr:hypothetical protein SVAN01_08570 [Stagonosporopsis vannaccii]
MPRIGTSLIMLSLAMLSVVNAIPPAPQMVASDNDNFWAQKPMHTTDLMAGTVRTAVQPSFTRTKTSTAAPRIRTLDEEINEL